jgi:2-polyprenyl-3-methyl-5-hydroxy-6-metoxy-1,4-benzoquinol methylase
MDDEDIRRFYGEGWYRKWLNMEQKAMDDDEKRRAQLDATIVKDFIGASIGSHLDIGASRGFFLNEVDAKVKYAVEPNREYVTQKNVSVYSDITEIRNEQFDLVSALHSLEHSTNPRVFLLEACLKVRDGGHLLIEVPSEQSPGGWPRLAHTFHFPTWTLFHMAARLHLTIKHLLFTPHTLVIMEK